MASAALDIGVVVLLIIDDFLGVGPGGGRKRGRGDYSGGKMRAG